MGTFSILFKMVLRSTPPIFSFVLIFPIFFLFVLDYISKMSDVNFCYYYFSMNKMKGDSSM